MNHMHLVLGEVKQTPSTQILQVKRGEDIELLISYPDAVIRMQTYLTFVPSYYTIWWCVQ